ncbi:MAG: RNA methyltransferase [Bacteroidota bacterium]
MKHRYSSNEITAAELKRYRSLLQKKYREKEQMYIVEGVRLCEELFQSPIKIASVLCTPDFGTSEQRQQQLLRLMKAREISHHRISQKQFGSISATEQSQGIVAICAQHHEPSEILVRRLTESPVVLLDRITDPGNLGTIIRTCAWFGAAAVFISRQSVDLYNPKAVRATMGGMFKIPIAVEVDLAAAIQALKKQGYIIYTSLTANAEPIEQIRFAANAALLFGNEAEGVHPAFVSMADHRITIPGGNVESLSVSVAVGIILSNVESRSF